MRYQKPMNIHTLLQDSPLAKIMQKGIRLNELNQQFQAFFPPEFRGLYRIANMEQNSLRIEVANAMVRQSFLFRRQELLTLIRQHLPEITELTFYINPEFRPEA
ncbi:DciA family protein [Aggregatibacter kilianii]|uniref:DciA family protein n=1 Tax=Aggregatibacter kilianii TaxID=2025884 RepID=UPI000D654AF8|nr:DciA family protein [Aggregatibacter kilianii]